MPSKPLHPCTYPGCIRLVTSGRCNNHKRQSNKDYDTYTRDKESKRFYDSVAWKKCREVILMRDSYLCQICLEDKILSPATAVHHKENLKTHRDKALDEDNLI